MNWTVIIVLVLLAGYIVSETVSMTSTEAFISPQRSDIGFAADGWEEYSGYKRDLRYAETFVDIQGLGVATDFCRAVSKVADPDTLRMSCAIGRRDGMDTMEYNSATKKEGFRFSRDDYFRKQKQGRRADYCRILKDETTGEWFAGCAIAEPTGFSTKRTEDRDSEPPKAIQKLLEAYEGILVWYRWQDDREDYAQNAAFSAYGKPIFPSMLRPSMSRGLQLNRWPAASQDAGEPAPPLRDYLRWGEVGTYELHQTIQPRQLRAIAFWIWWDAIEKEATVFESKNPSVSVGRKDRIALGVEGGGSPLPAAPRDPPVEPFNKVGGLLCAKQAVEVRPEVLQCIGPVTEPATLERPRQEGGAAAYYFEIWDEENRIMRLNGPMGSAKTGVWQHVAVTVTDGAAWWPTWQMWIDGSLVATKAEGRLSPAMELKENYIGQKVRGCIQDFRMYSTPMPPEKLQSAIAWSKPKLHLSP